MPVGSRAQAAAISRPRTAARATAASGVSTPATAAAASSPIEWPAATRSTGKVTRAANAAWARSAVATTRGWVTAVSRISSASAVVPSRSRSRSTAADQRARVSWAPAVANHGVSMPGVCAP